MKRKERDERGRFKRQQVVAHSMAAQLEKHRPYFIEYQDEPGLELRQHLQSKHGNFTRKQYVYVKQDKAYYETAPFKNLALRVPELFPGTVVAAPNVEFYNYTHTTIEIIQDLLKYANLVVSSSDNILYAHDPKETINKFMGCHENIDNFAEVVSLLPVLAQRPCKKMTGLALDKSGIWYFHSWAQVLCDGEWKIMESTLSRIAYLGIEWPYGRSENPAINKYQHMTIYGQQFWTKFIKSCPYFTIIPDRIQWKNQHY